MKRSVTEVSRPAAGNHTRPAPLPDDLSIGDLLRRIAADTSLLVQQEISLVRAEARESLERLKTTATGLAIAMLLALPAVMALTAFLVIALGQAIKSYWGAALIVGAVLAGASALLVQRAMAPIKKGRVGLAETKESIGETARWGKEEARAFKQELTA
jgi:uncharacterized membrane protein YqjE